MAPPKEESSTPAFPPFSRTGALLLVAVSLALGLALVDKPWGDGPMLDVRPDLRNLGRGGPLPQQTSPTASDDVATVVIPTAGEAEGDDTEEQRLAATRAAIEGLCEQLGPPPVRIERPCLEETGGRCTRRALDGLFDQLYAVATRQTEDPVRWSQLGDSMTAWVDAPTRFRALMQAQFGDAGIGLILPTDPGHARELQAVERRAGGWSVRTAPKVDDPDFGLPGAVFRGGWTEVRTPSPVDRVGVLADGRATVRLTVDGSPSELGLQPGLTTLEVPPADVVRFSGFPPGLPVSGLLLERSGPGVIVDNLGVVSMRSDQLLKVDDGRWVAQAQALSPDVLVFSYGAKSEYDNSWHRQPPPPEWVSRYERDYGAILERGRRVDGADCLVISLMTRAEPDSSGKRFVVFPTVPVTVQAQRRVAEQHGCAFFDSYAAMGGAEGADAWYWNEPRLLGFDLLHLTPAGYRRYGTMLYSSLMHAFRDYLAERE